jgi:hypothetical protein
MRASTSTKPIVPTCKALERYNFLTGFLQASDHLVARPAYRYFQATTFRRRCYPCNKESKE